VSEGADKQSVRNGVNVETRMVDGRDMVVVSERGRKSRHPSKRFALPHPPKNRKQNAPPPCNIPLVGFIYTYDPPEEITATLKLEG